MCQRVYDELGHAIGGHARDNPGGVMQVSITTDATTPLSMIHQLLARALSHPVVMLEPGVVAEQMQIAVDFIVKEPAT
jgi:hypothetical protein